MYNPVKVAWVAACMASHVALGVVLFYMQAVWRARPSAAEESHSLDGERRRLSQLAG